MSVAGKRFSAVVQPQGLEFDTSDSLTLLQAAELSGVRLPSSCRNGTCRTCFCRLLSGEVRYGIPWPGLSADEKTEGYILPCVAYPQSDVVMEAPGATQV